MKFVLIFAAIFAYFFALAYGFEKSDCSLPKEVGPCRKAAQSYFFNKDSKQCEEFIYGGCLGNANRFESKEECEKLCGDEKKE